MKPSGSWNGRLLQRIEVGERGPNESRLILRACSDGPTFVLWESPKSRTYRIDIETPTGKGWNYHCEDWFRRMPEALDCIRRKLLDQDG